MKNTGSGGDATFLHPRINVREDVLRALPACASLNEQQWLALTMSLVHRVLLIQGPPGTGKTKTAAALVSAHAQMFAKILLVKNSVCGRKFNSIADAVLPLACC